jgi:hypothetical protein
MGGYESMGGMSFMGEMSSMGGISSMGGMEGMGGNVEMGAMGTPPGGFMSMVSPMPSMPTTNDSLIPSPSIHSTNAHTTQV